jgi:hypothetical protein
LELIRLPAQRTKPIVPNYVITSPDPANTEVAK